MVREPNKTRSFRLSDTVANEIEKIINEDKIRSANDLFEKFIVAYQDSKTVSFKKSKKESDILTKDLSIIKKELAALLYLNGNIGDFLSMSEIKDIDSNVLVTQSREKVIRDIEKNQINKSFKNN